MKKTLIFICSLSLCLASCVSGPTAVTERTVKQYKKAIYEYQKILDLYMEDDYFLYTVSESKEWNKILKILGDPYEYYPNKFWQNYDSCILD